MKYNFNTIIKEIRKDKNSTYKNYFSNEKKYLEINQICTSSFRSIEISLDGWGCLYIKTYDDNNHMNNFFNIWLREIKNFNIHG